MKKAIFLFDYTGIMAKPWADAGYLCYCFDGQHPKGVSKSEHPNILNVGMWFSVDPNNVDDDKIIAITGKDVIFIFGFPECTDLATTGARHFAKKRLANQDFQKEAMELVALTPYLGELLECRLGLENPRSVISTKWRKPNFKFHPCDYANYLPENDEHYSYPDIYPTQDRYNKETWIWCGNGFVIPDKKRIVPLYKDNPGWKKCGGKSLKTKNIRSATPRGFAQAVFEANSN